MTWSYSGDPADSAKDQVRFLCGDVDTTDQLLSDEEIAWLLSERATVYTAAADACEAIVAKGCLVDKRVGDVTISKSQRAKHFTDLAARLRKRRTAARAGVAFGGATPGADVFTVTQFDHPGLGQAGSTGVST